MKALALGSTSQMLDGEDSKSYLFKDMHHIHIRGVRKTLHLIRKESSYHNKEALHHLKYALKSTSAKQPSVS